MNNKYLFIISTLLFLFTSCTAQTESKAISSSEDPLPPPYHQIPDYPENYNAATVAARMIDGLGYRYYWATEELREADLNYKPSEDSRTARATLDHLYNLSGTILNAIKQVPNVRPLDKENLNWGEKRQKTLERFEQASRLLKASKKGQVDTFEIIFKRGEQQSAFPFWNLLNGPIADAIYHVGQIVAYRRAAGNPLNPNVNVFMGKNRGQ